MSQEYKMEKMIWKVFLGLGLMFLFMGIVAFFTILNIRGKNIVKTTGYITDLGDDYTTIHYNIDGQEYEKDISITSSSYYIGKFIDIYYQPGKESKAFVRDVDFIVLIFPGISIIFLIIGFSGLSHYYFKGGKNKQLKKIGDLIYADYIESEPNMSYMINGRHPYNIICRWDCIQDNKRYMFKSENVWIKDIDEVVVESKIEKIPVYIDLFNKEKYYVDVSVIIEAEKELKNKKVKENIKGNKKIIL